MAHLAKFGGGIEGAKLYAHWSREQDENGEYITYSREHGGGHINRELTKNNFTIGEIHNREWIAERLKNVYQKPNQKRPVETCDIVVTLPQSESTDIKNVQQFMRAAYNSLKKQYGNNNNVVGCWVHLDEAQPHLHFAFLPISERNSKQKPEFKEKLSTRAYWPKKNSLQEMHRILQRDIDKEMGRHIEGINNGITKEQGGNKTIVELKTESKKEQEKLEKIRAESKEYATRVNLSRNDKSFFKSIDNKIEIKKKRFSREEYVEMSAQAYRIMRSIAENGIKGNLANIALKEENTALKKENETLKNDILTKRQDNKDTLERLRNENKELKKEKVELTKENNSLKSENKILTRAHKNEILYKNFIDDKEQNEDFKNWYNALPNNAKDGEPDAMKNALKDWKNMNQIEREAEEAKAYLKEVHI